MPRAALEMRMDLKHWAEALKLAEQLDPDAIATICKEHGAMLEMTGACVRGAQRTIALPTHGRVADDRVPRCQPSRPKRESLGTQ